MPHGNMYLLRWFPVPNLTDKAYMFHAHKCCLNQLRGWKQGMEPSIYVFTFYFFYIFTSTRLRGPLQSWSLFIFIYYFLILWLQPSLNSLTPIYEP